MAEGGETRGVEVGIAQHAPVEAGDRCEDGGTGRGDETEPPGGIAMPLADHALGTAGPGVEQAHAHGVGPVQGTGVQDDVVRPQPEPAPMHRPPPDHHALGVQHTLGTAAGAGGVDQEGRILGIGRGVATGLASVGQSGELIDLEHVSPREPRQRQVARGDHDGGVAVGRELGDLAGGQLGRGGDRHEAGGVGAEEGQGIADIVGEAEQHTAAARRSQPAEHRRPPAHGIVDLAKAP